MAAARAVPGGESWSWVSMTICSKIIRNRPGIPLPVIYESELPCAWRADVDSRGLEAGKGLGQLVPKFIDGVPALIGIQCQCLGENGTKGGWHVG